MDKKRIHEMLEIATEWCLGEMHSGKSNINIVELGQAIDIVKDLACAEKEVWEKCLLEKEYEQMEEDDKEMKRMGYDSARYADGRFAPKGRGGRRGYYPEGPQQPWYLPPMGYDGQSYGGSNMPDGNRGGSSSGRSNSGRSGYTPEDAAMMMDTMRNIFVEADPQRQQKMKEEFRKLGRDFGFNM